MTELDDFDTSELVLYLPGCLMFHYFEGDVVDSSYLERNHNLLKIFFQFRAIPRLRTDTEAQLEKGTHRITLPLGIYEMALRRCIST